jgi:uncharacterized protein DUF4136
VTNLKKYPYSVFALACAAKAVVTLVLLAGVVGCTSMPDVRVDKAPAANLGQYKTFSFYDPLATDRSTYTSIMSTRLKRATREELERHGYVYSERNPDLKVNFGLRVADRQELRSYPTGNGVFVRRAGLQDVSIVNYRQGTVSIDLVDNHLKTLLWQGIADGRVDDKMIEDPGKAIDTVVKQIFVGFPLSRKD